MKNIIIISFTLLISTVSKGQETIYFTNSNTYLEFGGAVFISANYERISEMVLTSKLLIL
ncbi:MAG: hypothetical protein WDZ80_06740 [Candidatus Paceibacterota bacterium]